jgi:hypothetical protein
MATAGVTGFRFSDSGILYFQPDNHLLCLFSTRIIVPEGKFYYLLKAPDCILRRFGICQGNSLIEPRVNIHRVVF